MSVKKTGKSQGILKWLISGDPESFFFICKEQIHFYKSSINFQNVLSSSEARSINKSCLPL